MKKIKNSMKNRFKPNKFKNVRNHCNRIIIYTHNKQTKFSKYTR